MNTLASCFSAQPGFAPSAQDRPATPGRSARRASHRSYRHRCDRGAHRVHGENLHDGRRRPLLPAFNSSRKPVHPLAVSDRARPSEIEVSLQEARGDHVLAALPDDSASLPDGDEAATFRKPVAASRSCWLRCCIALAAIRRTWRRPASSEVRRHHHRHASRLRRLTRRLKGAAPRSMPALKT